MEIEQARCHVAAPGELVIRADPRDDRVQLLRAARGARLAVYRLVWDHFTHGADIGARSGIRRGRAGLEPMIVVKG
jgi:hypothetical protein